LAGLEERRQDFSRGVILPGFVEGERVNVDYVGLVFVVLEGLLGDCDGALIVFDLKQHSYDFTKGLTGRQEILT
jgi:hypothetical protein